MKNKSLTGKMMAVAVISGVALGYKYMMDHPEVRHYMKNKAKCATKKMYDKLDSID